MIGSAARLLLRAFVILAVAAGTILLVRAFDSRRLPDLKPWHVVSLEREFTTENFSGTTFEDYLDVERSVFEELDARIYRAVEPADRTALNRFYRDSSAHPDNQHTNWNRSFEMIPEGSGPPVGGILLVHGLTDSPYSVRSTAEFFRERGFYVLAPRMPGHGTAPSGLLTASWHDWMAVVRLGALKVRGAVGAGKPLYMGGYSNGGALVIKYAFDSLEDAGLETPERVLLFSPAIGITKFAVFAAWHRALSFLPWFEKFKWESIYAEYDPYKYNSFPKNAGRQSYDLAEAIWGQIRDLSARNVIDRMPPVLAFQSVVDATVLTPALVERLYDSLRSVGSELVLFDVNRNSGLEPFLKDDVDVFLASLETAEERLYRLTVVTSSGKGTDGLLAKHHGAGVAGFDGGEPLGLTWPQGIYSLSHVALPFRPDDPIYGRIPGRESAALRLGDLQPQGEKGVTTVPIGMLMRLRSNPFFSYVEERMDAFCPACREKL